jgi:hypothetical protein
MRVDDAHLKSELLFGRSCRPLLPSQQVCFTPNILECIRNFLEENGTSAGFQHLAGSCAVNQQGILLFLIIN